MKSYRLILMLIAVGSAAGLSLPCYIPIASLQTDNRDMRVQESQQAERRVALVIGNSAYKDSPLTNPVNDARDMAQTLRGLGFEVIYGENLSQNDMKRNTRAFGEKIRNGGVGLFYFAGHGVQVRGSNYLIPVGATITSEEEVEYESVDVGLVLAQMEAARNRLNIVILDACRNNPFARSFRSVKNGLASIDAPSGTLIAYATAPGSVASDGTGRNGLYTQEVLKHIRMPKLSIEQVFKQVRIAVRSKTQGKQIPWESSSLEGEFYFSASPPASKPAVDPAAMELSFWESIKSSTDVEDFREYVKEYPNGRYVGLARNRIRQLEAASNSNAPATEPAGEKKQEHVELQTYTETAGGAAIEMVRVPPGKFTMGSPDGEGEADEHPQHEVTVSSFYMGKYEVTQGQWRAVARLPKVRIDLNPNPSKFDGNDNLPVEQVSWEEAMEFCARLSKATGKTYRLPTEAEWEYACRAMMKGQYAGNLDSMAWYNSNSTHPVGKKQANRFGLYDMHGNVWEWCMDRYSETYYNQSPNTDPVALIGSSRRVNRGGSWSNLGQFCRSAIRGHISPNTRLNAIGFRLARALN